MLPGSLQEEDEGVVTQIEGRVIKINKAVDSPGGAREDWRIIQDIARKLGRERGFTFASPREIFEELRRASAGGIADYSGITYERLESEYGVFWPCPSEDHPGTPRLFEEGSWNPIARGKGRFYFPDGKARFVVAPYTPPAEDVDDDYPIILTTGRVVSQFLSGTQTRRIGPLVDQCPEPLIEMHPHLAKKLGIADGDWATVESRRGVVHAARAGGHDDPAGHGVRALPLGRRAQHQPRDHRGPGPDLQDPGIQGVRGARAQGGGPPA